MWAIPTGLYLLGTRSGERRNLMTTSWVTQVARDPKLLGVSVERHAVSSELIRTGRCFSLNLIPRSRRELVRRFVRPAEHDPTAHTLGGEPYRDAQVSGAPIVLAAAAWLDCSLEREVDLGTHTLYIGEVVDAAFAEPPGDFEVLRMEDTRMNYGG